MSVATTPSMQEYLLTHYSEIIDETIKKVMSTVLNREPTFDDAKDFTFVTSVLFPDIAMIAYNDELLGRVYFHWSNNANECKVSYVFAPAKNFIEASLIDITADY